VQTILYGEYELTIDDKGRMLVPAEVRKSLDPERDGESFFLIVSGDGRPWMYAVKAYESMVSRLESQLSPTEDRLAFDRMNFGMTAKVEPDKQGRIVLPEKTLKRTNIGRDVTLVGARDHLELWNRSDWEEYSQALIARRPKSPTI